MKNLAHLNKYFIKYKWHLLLGVILVIGSNFFMVIQPKLVSEALDSVLGQLKLYEATTDINIKQEIVASASKTAIKSGALILFYALVMSVFMYFMRQTLIVMSRLIERDLKNEVFEHYEKLDLAFYKMNNTGDLMARITEDVSKVRMYLGPAILYSINMLTTFIFVIGSMLFESVELTLYTLIPLPFLSYSIYYISNIIHKRSGKIQGQLSIINSIAQENFSGAKVIKSFVRQDEVNQHFTKEITTYKDLTLKLARTEAFFRPLMIFLIGVSTIITLYLGGLQVVEGNLTPGKIAAFVIYVNMLNWPVTAIGWIASIIQQAEISQKRINEFLKTQPSIESPISDQKINGDIVFQNVSFTYPDSGTIALKNINFELKSGEKMAILGRTGSGKTTIADLLVRMYDTTSGVIKINNYNIKTIDLNELRSKIGYVTQDVFLFSDSIANNISIGVEKTDLTQIKKYTKIAAIDDFIESLPEKYDAQVGERGVTLSGGQKQRIAIARTLIKKPEILVMDDCLSAIDTQTEHEILKHLDENLKDKTTIIITHRIFTMIKFDKIIVLDNGHIIESGTPQQLYAQKGFYYDMLQKQSNN